MALKGCFSERSRMENVVYLVICSSPFCLVRIGCDDMYM